MLFFVLIVADGAEKSILILARGMLAVSAKRYINKH